MDNEKQIRWIGSAYDDLLAFSRDARKEAGFQLGKVQAQAGIEPTGWKPFDAVGAGTKEIRIRDERHLSRDVCRQVRGSHLCLALLSEEDSGYQQAGPSHCRGSLSGSGQAEEGKEMKIDTKIRHVTKPGANLFLELGFTPDEAKRLQAASRKQINDTRLLKQQLMEELSVWIAKHHLKQAEAAEVLMVSRPRVSDVVNKKTAKFTIDTLVEMLSRVGKPVKLAIN
jgi:predicted XRE-type DNA-binding protein